MKVRHIQTNCKKLIYTHSNLLNKMIQFDNKIETENKIEGIVCFSPL